jgi:hypothetical protein
MIDLTKIDKPFGELERWEKMALFGAWLDGEKIEFRWTVSGVWESIQPSWSPTSFYRVKPKPALDKPSINWDHVSPKYKWLAREKTGNVCLYCFKPKAVTTVWTDGRCVPLIASTFASLDPGTCDWKDSLVGRAE